jgi:REP element-mobilizing transposase RayT
MWDLVFQNKERIMPRKKRFYLPGMPVHIVQRGKNRQAIFLMKATTDPILAGLKRLWSVMHASFMLMC